MNYPLRVQLFLVQAIETVTVIAAVPVDILIRAIRTVTIVAGIIRVIIRHVPLHATLTVITVIAVILAILIVAKNLLVVEVVAEARAIEEEFTVPTVLQPPPLRRVILVTAVHPPCQVTLETAALVTRVLLMKEVLGNTVQGDRLMEIDMRLFLCHHQLLLRILPMLLLILLILQRLQLHMQLHTRPLNLLCTLRHRRPLNTRSILRVRL